ncbi:Ribosomal RNA large subunit methyltransferase J [invertebrate metagenome]|uniref:Ribosomal RNA large subunit methyltransferase J n=1 Tax=invertebrate metagenome TaxID=1711999 RepID=A0A2H9T812_9ZZZZ
MFWSCYRLIVFFSFIERDHHLLSYRHSFHAGNFADVLKHVVLVEILDHLTKKSTPFEYVDTHSGTGLYNLKSSDAQKLHEYTGGISRLDSANFPELEDYFKVVRFFNRSDRLDFYPGSPAIAKYFLRHQDRGWLFELQPEDCVLLRKNIVNNKKIRVQCQDGFQGLNALLPLTSRRGLVLIDPSYEIKSDYDQVVDSVIHGYKKFSQGIYAIWYPVVDRQVINKMERKIIKSGIKNIQRFELGLSADSAGRGMTASGMIVINPPWTLFDKMSCLLPKLAQQLTDNHQQFYKCDIIANE